MAAIPMPRKMSGETYDVDGFIDKLLASQKFDKLTEVFADKTAYKIKTLDTIPIDIEKKRSSKKRHENSNSESNSGSTRHPLLIDLPDEAHKQEHRKLNPTVYFKGGDILPNEDLSLKYKYLTRNVKKKNNSSDYRNINKLKSNYKNDKHSSINNEDHETFIELKKESENKIIADQNQNETNGTVENNHGDGYDDINYKSSKIDHELVNEEHENTNTKEHGDLKDPEYSQLHGDDSENDATHSKTEHYAGPEFKTKIDSSEHEAANNNTPTAISEENLRDVTSDEKTSVTDHTQEVTAKNIDKEENIEIQNLTTTHGIEETVTTNNTGQEIHADNDMMGTPHFRTHFSEESDQTSNELRYPLIPETNHIETQKLNEKLGQDKTYTPQPAQQEKADNHREDTLEKERRERAKMEKIIKDRLQEEERLQEAAANYEKKEREEEAARKRKQQKQPSGEDIETNLRENAGKYKIPAKWVNEKLKYEKMLMEEAEREEKAIREKGNELIKERLQYEKMLKNDAEKQEREDIEREIKQRQDFEAEREKKFMKERTEFKIPLKKEAFLAAKLEKERLEQLAKEKEDYVKKLQEQYSEYEDETNEEKRKDTEKGVVSPPHTNQEKKKPPKETQTLKDLAYKDNRAVELSEEKFSKEKQMQFRAQTLENSNNQLNKDVTDENVSSDDSEVPTKKEQYVKASLQTNNQLNVEHKGVEDVHKDQGTYSESSDEDQGSGNEGSTTIDPNMMRREGDKVYAFVQDPEYAEYQEAYAKHQKEHPYNPADFM